MKEIKRKSLTNEEVADFLLFNPDFLSKNPEILNSIEVIHETGGAVHRAAPLLSSHQPHAIASAHPASRSASPSAAAEAPLRSANSLSYAESTAASSGVPTHSALVFVVLARGMLRFMGVVRPCTASGPLRWRSSRKRTHPMR